MVLDMLSDELDADSTEVRVRIALGRLVVASLKGASVMGQSKKLALASLDLSSSGTSIPSSAPTCVIISHTSSCVGAAIRIHKHLLRTGSITCEMSSRKTVLKSDCCRHTGFERSAHQAWPGLGTWAAEVFWKGLAGHLRISTEACCGLQHLQELSTQAMTAAFMQGSLTFLIRKKVVNTCL